MANSDYVIRGSGYICPTATLLNSPNPGTTVLSIGGFTAQDGVLPPVGSAIMVNDEIMRLDAVSATSLTVGRGCADTIPVGHASNSRVWFFDNSKTGYDNREYMATETVGVKLLMQTIGSTMETKNSPPNSLTFNSRFARPYAPGLVQVNGNPFHALHTLDDTVTSLVLTWAHRDRILQMDQLQDHTNGNIGPEPGTTYTLELFKGDETTPRVSNAGITAATFTYTRATVIAAFEITEADDVTGHITLKSVRGGFDSWQTYRMNIGVEEVVVLPDPPPTEEGWGVVGWGYGWGN